MKDFLIFCFSLIIGMFIGDFIFYNFLWPLSSSKRTSRLREPLNLGVWKDNDV